jgi:hypothetical protein
MVIQERYNSLNLAANSTTVVKSNNVAGFMAVTAGTIQITKTDGTDVFPVALTVVASVYYPIPVFIGNEGGTVVLAGGASGALFV